MAEKNFAFEQVQTENKLLAEEVDEWAGDDEQWTIRWTDSGDERTTTLKGMAFYAEQWDENADVEVVE